MSRKVKSFTGQNIWKIKVGLDKIFWVRILISILVLEWASLEHIVFLVLWTECWSQGEHEEPARDHAVLSLQQRLFLELPQQDHPGDHPQVSLKIILHTIYIPRLAILKILLDTIFNSPVSALVCSWSTGAGECQTWRQISTAMCTVSGENIHAWKYILSIIHYRRMHFKKYTFEKIHFRLQRTI